MAIGTSQVTLHEMSLAGIPATAAAAECIADAWMPGLSGCVESRLQQLGARRLLTVVVLEALEASDAPSMVGVLARIRARVDADERDELTQESLALRTLDLVLSKASLPASHEWGRARAIAAAAARSPVRPHPG